MISLHPMSCGFENPQQCAFWCDQPLLEMETQIFCLYSLIFGVWCESNLLKRWDVLAHNCCYGEISCKELLRRDLASSWLSWEMWLIKFIPWDVIMWLSSMLEVWACGIKRFKGLIFYNHLFKKTIPGICISHWGAKGDCCGLVWDKKEERWLDHMDKN